MILELKTKTGRAEHTVHDSPEAVCVLMLLQRLGVKVLQWHLQREKGG